MMSKHKDGFGECFVVVVVVVVVVVDTLSGPIPSILYDTSVYTPSVQS